MKEIRPTVIVEHLEPCLTPWLLKEYEFVSSVVGPERLLFTNVPPAHTEALSRYGKVTEKRVWEVAHQGTDVIVLDPVAEEVLRPEEATAAEYVVIGGIMGDHPPKKRTWAEITSRMPWAKARNIGKGQLTIAGAAYVLMRIVRGARLEELDLREGLTIEVVMPGGLTLEVELPYVFPYEGGEPVLPEGYADVVARKTIYYERDPCIG